MKIESDKVEKIVGILLEYQGIQNPEINWAINELDDFAMTIDILDSFKIAQILQNIRKSGKLDLEKVEKIRFLIKCWRTLVTEKLDYVIPSLTRKLSITSNELNEKNDEVVENCTLKNGNDKQEMENNFKPKLKSTKDLLANVSNFIGSDTTNKILNKKIEQEDDDINLDLAIHEEMKLRERINKTVRYADIQQLELQHKASFQKMFFKKSNCEKLVKKFHMMYSKELIIVANSFIPWKNLHKSLDFSDPNIVISKHKNTSSVKLLKNSSDPSIYPGAFPEPIVKQIKPKKLKNRELSVNYISQLLDSYEARETRKILIQEERKINKINKTETPNFKLKLKIPQPKIPRIKIRRKKIKKPKTKKITKLKRIPKVREKIKPPITNYLDDIPNFDSINIYDEYEESKEFSIDMYSVVLNNSYLHILPWIDFYQSSKPHIFENAKVALENVNKMPQYYC